MKVILEDRRDAVLGLEVVQRDLGIELPLVVVTVKRITIVVFSSL